MITESSSGTRVTAAESRQNKSQDMEPAENSPGNDNHQGASSAKTDLLKEEEQSLSAQPSYEFASSTARSDKLKGAESDIIDDIFNYCKFYVVDMSSFRGLVPDPAENNWESLMAYIDERWKAYDEQLIAKAIADATPGIAERAVAEARPGIIADAFSNLNKNLCKMIIEQLRIRFGSVTDRLKSRLSAVRSPETLASFIILAINVKSIKDFEKNLEDALQHQPA